MRRKDREKDIDFAKRVFEECEYATIAMLDTDSNPYCIPISPVIYSDVIYFHCAIQGRKLDCIKNSNNVCISAVSYTNLLPDRFTTEYKSAVAKGICEIVTDEDEILFALKLITQKYALSNMNAFSQEVENSIGKLYIVKINIYSITGKENIAS